jgi:hypothetical protein
MEKPTIDPATGEANWQSNGARQRFALRMVKELSFDRVFAAAGQIMRRQMVARGEIGPEDGVSISIDDVVNWLQWRTLRQLKVLRRIAKDLGEPEEVSIN